MDQSLAEVDLAPLPPLLANEPERLAALRRYRVLDTSPEPNFDRITRLASLALEVPMALVSLVDEARQWFKARCGLEATETPREISFCTHAIRSPGIFIVADATRDPRFADNPLVVGEPKIRFYAGVPLQSTDGHAIGTLCVIDTVPRRIDERQQQILVDLAAQVIHELEIRSALGDLYQLEDAQRREESERRRAADAELRRLANRNQLLAAAIDASPVGVTIVDRLTPGYPVAYVNAAFCGMTGRSPEELVSRGVYELHALDVSPAVIDQIRDETNRAVTERRSLRIEMPIMRGDGSSLISATTLAPVFDDDGRCIATVGLYADVTERRQQEAAERERQKLVALGQLAGGVAHEINNLLQPIISLSQLAWDRLEAATDEDERGDLETVLDCSRAAREIVSKILLFARKESPTLVACDLPAEIRGAIGFVRALLPGGIALEEAFAAGIAGTATINAGELRQVLTNLAVNAAHAMGGNGTATIGLATVTLSRQEAAALEVDDGEYFALTVSDTGCGIDESVAARIFDPFFTTKPLGQGTGLGLSVAYGILRNWGGAISARSVVGQGTAFILHIPATTLQR